jgi:flagellar biosynthesis protein FlhF
VLPNKVSKSLQYTYLGHELEKLNEYVSKLIFDDYPKILIEFREILKQTGVTEYDAMKLLDMVKKRMKGIPVLSKALVMGSLEAATQVYLKGRKLIRNYEQKVIALVGPAGVGKTLSVMKLATNKQIMGERRISVISTDSYRMAAGEMLSKFAKLTSIPVYETRNVEEFSNRIAKLNKSDVILIDTPGNNIQENKYFSEMETYFQKVPNIKKLLVLSGCYDQQIIEKYIEEYSKMDITGMIITKIDELNYPGKCLSIAMSTNLPIYFLGTGQSIPGDIEENKDGYLWQKLESRIKELLND